MLLGSKIAIVTGASKGIGRALAVGLAREGAAVVVNYKSDQAGAEETCKTIRASGGSAEAIQADISQKCECEELVDQTVSLFGRIDVLVNNSARTRFAPLLEVTEEDWLDVVNTNLRGTYFTTAAAVRHMMRTGAGCIINVSSCAARLMIPFHSVYTMSKGGIEALTCQLALELAPVIRVNCISPAPTSTDRNRRYDPHYDENWGRVIPMQRVAQPEDMAGAVVFLASEQARFITGQIIQIDGGWTLKGHTPDLSQEDFSSDRRLG